MISESFYPCPICDSPIRHSESEPGKNLICDVCGIEFSPLGHLCPICMAYHQENAGICNQCGSPMVRFCRVCHTANWAGDSHCKSCGKTMDIMANVSKETGRNTVERLHKQMEASALKRVEEPASNSRMAELMAIEEARQMELKQRIVKQKEQERRLLILMFTVISLFFIGLIVYALFSATG